QKLSETAPQRGITAQFLHHHRDGPQQQPVAAGFSSNRQQQPQPYLTTIRLTTPAGDTGSIIKRPLLKTILQNEHSYPFTKTSMTSTVTEYTSSFYDPQNINAMAQTVFHPPQTTEYVQPSKAPLSNEIRTPFVTPVGPFVTTVSPPLTVRPATTTTTTASPVVTSTERIFSHYKQPATSAPMERGPLYLIIEGHSKVKTYGLNTNDTLMQLPRMVPVASTRDPIVRHV
ncbi:transcription initiation factor TFIID subunit 12-like, partial [Anopheles bellator]|uniref:transcription initiation factor TFIID subunit 12-like n=1 Tax=Anopheles bellator TaxID=139047 RepID=UPI00264880FB